MDEPERYRGFLHWAMASLAVLGLAVPWLPGEDCNGNGVADELDVAFSFDPPLASLVLTERYPDETRAGDLDGDGDLDLVLSSGLYHVAILRNLGDANFEPWAEVKLDLQPQQIAILDLDGDKDLDLAVVAFRNNAEHLDGALCILRNQGDGEFDPVSFYATRSSPRFLAALDWDRDGDPDLAVANRLSGTISLFENVGQATFSTLQELPAGSGPVHVHSADLTEDGHPDLVFLAHAPAGVLLAAGRGDGAFEGPSILHAGEQISFLDAADLDGDGDADLVIEDPGNKGFTVLRNDGGLAFRDSGTYEVGAIPRDIGVADFDGDGAMDLAVVSQVERNLSVLTGHGGGTFRPAVDYYVGLATRTGMTAGDLDGDGDADLVFPAGSGKGVGLLLNRGDGSFAAPLFHTAAGGEGLYTPQLFDFNGDQRLDLLLRRHNLSDGYWFTIEWNDGSGRFDLSADLSFVGGSTDVEVFDAEGDGDLDIIASHPLGIQLHRNRGDGGFDVSALPRPPVPFTSIATGDFDGDRKTDIALPVECPASVVIERNLGDGSFDSPYTAIIWHQTTFSPPVRILVGDFDGDRQSDVFVGRHGDQQPTLYLSRGGMRFQVRVQENVWINEWSLASDVDGDSDVDIVSTDVRSVDLYLNDGTGAFSKFRKFAVDGEPRAVADVDGNGALDILATDVTEDEWNEGSVLALLNVVGSPASGALRVAAAHRPYGLAAGDLDGDGRLDLAVTTLGNEFRPPALTLLHGITRPPASLDRNGNSVPDECESLPFHRGDASNDGAVNISDASFLIDYILKGGVHPRCGDAADANDDDRVDIADPIYILNFLYRAGPVPPDPGVVGNPCGPDRESPGANGDLGCGVYDHC